MKTDAELESFVDDTMHAGRTLIDARDFAMNYQSEYVQITAVWLLERERVRRYGECRGGCGCTQPMDIEGLKQVCPHTGQACEKQQLRNILDIYGKLFR